MCNSISVTLGYIIFTSPLVAESIFEQFGLLGSSILCGAKLFLLDTSKYSEIQRNVEIICKIPSFNSEKSDPQRVAKLPPATYLVNGRSGANI